MLKIERRDQGAFLSAEQVSSLEKRVKAAEKLATDTALTATVKSARITAQWDKFRQGKTSEGVFDALEQEMLTMCFQKCAFCETPALILPDLPPEVDTVEHRQPKAQHVALAFTWSNLLPACATCNRRRENSGIAGLPLDLPTIEPLDYLGWTEHGDFEINPEHERVVEATITMYGLRRFREERAKAVVDLATLLEDVAQSETIAAKVIHSLKLVCTATTAWRGPVREYLLRPPSEAARRHLQAAVARLPEIRTWVADWLRPPDWADAIWRTNGPATQDPAEPT